MEDLYVARIKFARSSVVAHLHRSAHYRRGRNRDIARVGHGPRPIRYQVDAARGEPGWNRDGHDCRGAGDVMNRAGNRDGGRAGDIRPHGQRWNAGAVIDDVGSQGAGG